MRINWRENCPTSSNLPLLEDLVISDNKFSGEFPDFSNLPNLQALTANRCQFSGRIPSFENSLQLSRIGLLENDLKGVVPAYSNHRFLESIDISKNKLTFEDLLPNFTETGKGEIFPTFFRIPSELVKRSFWKRGKPL